MTGPDTTLAIVWILIIHIPFHDMTFDEVTGNHETYAAERRCEIAKRERVAYYRQLDAQNHTSVAGIAAASLECVPFDIIGASP